MKPIVKWAGGKRQLLPYINEMLPKHFNNYFEPFAGGLAVLFELQPKNAIINDINKELINLYNHVKNNPNEVMKILTNIDKMHELSEDCKAYYYTQRDIFNNDIGSMSIEQAARFIYINKHAFNGLYRVNSSGLFNVPFNTKKSGKSFEKDNILEVSKYLKNVKILHGDFKDAVKNAQKGDFVFFDSPYAPINPTSFTDYTKEGFGYDDHVRLSDLYKDLTKKGVYCMLTNHNTELINELYNDFNIKVVNVKRMINSDASNRVGQEVIITNYDI